MVDVVYMSHNAHLQQVGHEMLLRKEGGIPWQMELIAANGSHTNHWAVKAVPIAIKKWKGNSIDLVAIKMMMKCDMDMKLIANGYAVEIYQK